MISWEQARDAVTGMGQEAVHGQSPYYESNRALVERLDAAAGQFAATIVSNRSAEIAEAKRLAETSRDRLVLWQGRTIVGSTDILASPQQVTWKMSSERFPIWTPYERPLLHVRDDGSWGIYGIEVVVTPGDDAYYNTLIFGREPGKPMQVPGDKPIDPLYEEVAMHAMVASLQFLGLSLPT